MRDTAYINYLGITARAWGTGGIGGKSAGGGDATRIVAELGRTTVTLLAIIHHPVAAAGALVHSRRHVPQTFIRFRFDFFFDDIPAAGAPQGVRAEFGATVGDRNKRWKEGVSQQCGDSLLCLVNEEAVDQWYQINGTGLVKCVVSN